MEPSTNKARREKITTAVLDAIVKGESQEHLLSALRSRCDEQTAQQILDDANKKYDALKTNESLADYEYNLYFDRTKNRMSKREVAGLSLILCGIGATALSYLTAAMSEVPGQKYFLFFGMIAAGAYMLMFSDRD